MQNQLNILKENLESDYLEKTNEFFNNNFLIKKIKYKEQKIHDIEKKEELKKLSKKVIILENEKEEHSKLIKILKEENKEIKEEQEKLIKTLKEENKEIINENKNNLIIYNKKIKNLGRFFKNFK